MRVVRLCVAVIVLSVLIVPSSAHATEAMTRRDGFLLLWQSIRRPVESNREAPFADVPAGAKGASEITYAKYRGIIDDDVTAFRPDEPLMLDDALLWLLRTRSVADIKDLTPDAVPGFLPRFGLDDQGQKSADGTAVMIKQKSLTEADLLELMRTVDQRLVEETHEVSLYAEKFHGKGTAFGEQFDMHAMTAAHRTFPKNTLVRVTNVSNGKSVVVRINDRGPYVKGRDLDLSLGAFTTIAERSKGKIRATFQRLGDASMVGVCGPSRYQQRVWRMVILSPGVPHALALGQTIVFQGNQSFLVESVRYPDGQTTRLHRWVRSGEAYPFIPSVEGAYMFRVGAEAGRTREMRTIVRTCT